MRSEDAICGGDGDGATDRYDQCGETGMAVLNGCIGVNDRGRLWNPLI